MWRLTFTMCVCALGAMAQPQPCPVTRQGVADVVTTTIAFSDGTVSLTLPPFEFGYENMLLTIETQGTYGPSLKLQVGGESSPIENGAVLHVRLKPLERLVFSVMRNGEVECTWAPHIRAGDPPTKRRIAAGHVSGFQRNEIALRPVGDPVELVLFHNVEEVPREVKIGGLPATVLAETSVYLILRDPWPATGTRTVVTRGESSLLHFAEIQRRMVPTSASSALLEIQGRDVPEGYWSLGIGTAFPERFTLGKGCGGKAGPTRDTGAGGGQELPRKREFKVSCEIQSKGLFPVDPDAFTTLIVRHRGSLFRFF